MRTEFGIHHRLESCAGLSLTFCRNSLLTMHLSTILCGSGIFSLGINSPRAREVSKALAISHGWPTTKACSSFKPLIYHEQVGTYVLLIIKQQSRHFYFSTPVTFKHTCLNARTFHPKSKFFHLTSRPFVKSLIKMKGFLAKVKNFSSRFHFGGCV